MEILLAVVVMTGALVGVAWLSLRGKKDMLRASCGAIDPTSGKQEGCACYPDGKPAGADCKDPDRTTAS